MRTALKAYAGAFDPSVLSIDSLKSSNLGRIACLRFWLGRTFCAVSSWRKKSTEMTGLRRSERALKNEILQIDSYGAPLLLCSDYVPPKVLSAMLCGRLRLRRPRVPQSRPLQATTPEAARRLFCTPEKFTFLGAPLALPVRQTRICSLLR